MIKFIKMKKKIIFAVATGFFAVATVFNMNLLQGNSVGDVSLDAITVMAQAQSEGGSNLLPEVEIRCGYGSGRCYMEGEPIYRLSPFGLPYCSTTCEFSGWQSDFCVPGMPC